MLPARSAYFAEHEEEVACLIKAQLGVGLIHTMAYICMPENCCWNDWVNFGLFSIDQVCDGKAIW